LDYPTKLSLLSSPVLAGLSTILSVFSFSVATLGILLAYAYLLPTDQSIVQVSSHIATAGAMATWTAIAIGLSLPLGLFGLRNILDSKPQTGASVVIVTLVCAILAALAQWFNLTSLRRIITMTEVLSGVVATVLATVGMGVSFLRKNRISGT
jgi:hypothetical protein